jgi:predicted dienelactone hydrolase
MQTLETVFVLIVLAFLVAQNARAGIPRKVQLGLFAAALATLGTSAVLGQIRWQMAPTYLVFAISSLLLLRHAYAHVAVRSVGVVLGILLLAIGVTLSVGLPILVLPAPNGPHVVGSSSLSLLDESRDNALFGAPEQKRELYLQIWYPGELQQDDGEARARTLWQELYRGDRDFFTLLAGYLRGIETHSYPGIPLSPSQAAYPVIVFSHAIVSFAEQNTLLMEHLASHGYIVVAISHTYMSMRVVSSDGKAIYPALDKVNEASAPFDAAGDDVTARIARASTPQERAEIHLRRYEQAAELNELMAIWVDDLRFVLDSITASSDPKLQPFSMRIDPDRIGLLGMSFGGGAVTEFCKLDPRCRAALNIDGGTFGQRQRQPLQVPYLALVREDQRSLDYLLAASQSDYYDVEVAGARHLDFTDDTLVLPILKWLGMTGSIAATRVVEITNAVSLRFFDAYLRGGPKPRFEEFPELTVQMNAQASQ